MQSPAIETGFRFTKFTLFLIIVLFAASFALDYYRRKKIHDKVTKKILKKYPAKLRNYGIALLVLFYFIEVRLPYLSWRLWLLLLFIAFVISMIRAVRGFKPEYKARTRKLAHNAKTDKYLPKKKKK